MACYSPPVGDEPGPVLGEFSRSRSAFGSCKILPGEPGRPVLLPAVCPVRRFLRRFLRRRQRLGRSAATPIYRGASLGSPEFGAEAGGGILLDIRRAEPHRPRSAPDVEIAFSGFLEDVQGRSCSSPRRSSPGPALGGRPGRVVRSPRSAASRP